MYLGTDEVRAGVEECDASDADGEGIRGSACAPRRHAGQRQRRRRRANRAGADGEEGERVFRLVGALAGGPGESRGAVAGQTDRYEALRGSTRPSLEK